MNASHNATEHVAPITAGTAAPMDRAALRHTLRNSLYSILLHVHCAQNHMEQGNVQAIAENLASIRAAVLQSQELAGNLTDDD